MRLSIIAIITCLSLTCLGQSSDFQSWTIAAVSLSGGKVSVEKGQTKSISFSVTASRSGTSAVNLTFKLVRLDANTVSTFYDISSAFSITTADFPSGVGQITKSFSTNVTGASNTSSPSSQLRNNDEIFLFITEASSPTGFFVASKSYFAAVTEPSGTRALPDEFALPSQFTATAVSDTQILLKWKDNANNESGFRVEFGEMGNYFPNYRMVPGGANVTSFLMINLNPGTGYMFRIQVANLATSWLNGPQASGTTLPDDCPEDLTLVSGVNVYNRKASNSITTSTGFILSALPNASVIFTAGNEIKFQDGTRIPSGQRFTASIVPCGVSGFAMADPINESLLSARSREDIWVYPNPSQGVVRIFLKDKMATKGYVKVMNKFSETVYSQEISGGRDSLDLNLIELPEDTYYVQVSSGNKKVMTRMAIVR